MFFFLSQAAAAGSVRTLSLITTLQGFVGAAMLPVCAMMKTHWLPATLPAVFGAGTVGSAFTAAAPAAGSAELLPPFRGTDVPVDSGYKWEPAKIAQLGLRASIRDADGQPTNCDGGKPWIGDIAATAAKGGMRPYAWYSPDEPPAFAPLAKPLRECTIGLVSTSGCYPMVSRAVCRAVFRADMLM